MFVLASLKKRFSLLANLQSLLKLSEMLELQAEKLLCDGIAL